MNQEKLKQLLNTASNKEELIIGVIELFMPKIVASSFYNGKFSEDIKQEIIIELYKNITNFKEIKEIFKN